MIRVRYGLSINTDRKDKNYSRLVVLGFNATLTAKVISGRLVMHKMLPGFLTPVLTQHFFPKPPTTLLICFCRGEGRKYAVED